MEEEGIKPGPLKRVFRNVLLAAVEGYYVEKLWIQKVMESLVSSINFHNRSGDASSLNPFAAFLECVVDVATQASLYSKYDDFKSSMLLIHIVFIIPTIK